MSSPRVGRSSRSAHPSPVGSGGGRRSLLCRPAPWSSSGPPASCGLDRAPTVRSVSRIRTGSARLHVFAYDKSKRETATLDELEVLSRRLANEAPVDDRNANYAPVVDLSRDCSAAGRSPREFRRSGRGADARRASCPCPRSPRRSRRNSSRSSRDSCWSRQRAQEARRCLLEALDDLDSSSNLRARLHGRARGCRAVPGGLGIVARGRSGGPSRALANYGETLRERRNRAYVAVRIHSTRARVHLAMGLNDVAWEDIERAQATLDEALNELGGRRLSSGRSAGRTSSTQGHLRTLAAPLPQGRAACGRGAARAR